MERRTLPLLPRLHQILFPEIDANIDWNRGYEFLDKELQQIAPDAEIGLREADKLVKVWRFDGEETWVLSCYAFKLGIPHYLFPFARFL